MCRMKEWFENGEPALRWLRHQIAEDRGGYVLLAGFDAQGPRAAWAAGLRGERDYSDFAIFARFALHRLNDCDGYWLLLPAEFGKRLGYHMDLRSPWTCWSGQARLLGKDPGQDPWELAAGAAGPWMEDLSGAGPQLPGIMRRDLGQLAERLAIAPPDPVCLFRQ
jgi:hypothetical protein